LNNINNILQQNNYNINIIASTKKEKLNTSKNQEKTKWAMFTYMEKETRKITKIFQNTTIKIAYRTKNNIQHILRPKLHRDKYDNNGIYRMKCLDCPMVYIGQTGRKFNTRYKEKTHYIFLRNGCTTPHIKQCMLSLLWLLLITFNL
jgi:hypothetical protein